MHHAVPDIYKPSLFDVSGRQLPFPEPTKRIRMPRLRRKTKDQSDAESDVDGCGEGADSFSSSQSRKKSVKSSGYSEVVDSPSSQSKKKIVNRNLILPETDRRNTGKDVPVLPSLEVAISRGDVKATSGEAKAITSERLGTFMDSSQLEPDESTPRCDHTAINRESQMGTSRQQSTESTPRCEPFTSMPSPGQWVWGS
jgi:hypothetical protein